MRAKEPESVLNIFYNKDIADKNNQNLSLKINYIGYEIQDELCWIYLETEPLEKEAKNIKVHQNMMYNFIKEQMHIVSFSYLNNTNSNQKCNELFLKFKLNF